MQNMVLKHNFKQDRRKFYQQQLFDGNRVMKKWLGLIGLGAFLYDFLQGFFFLPKEVMYDSPNKIWSAVAILISLISYCVSISKKLEKRSMRIRQLLIFIAIACLCFSQGLRAYGEAIDRIKSHDIEKWYYSLLKGRNLGWMILLIDVLIPDWYLKLLVPSSDWIALILAYYNCDLEYKGMVWSCFAMSTVLTMSLWGLKAFFDWRLFLNKANVEAWDDVHRYILDKVPDALAIVDPSSKVIYSNVSFKALCQDNLENLSKKLSKIKKSDGNYSTNICAMEPNVKDSFSGHEEKQSFHHSYEGEEQETFLTLFQVLQTVMEPLVKGMIKLDTYITFNAKIGEDNNPNHPQRSYEIKIGPLLEHGKVILILSDTTQRDLVVSLETVNQYKDKLLATVSHDLRAPINGSLTFIENSIQHETVPTFIKDQFLIPAQRSCKFLLHLVNDILDFSQINAQKLRMNFEALSLIDTIKNCYQLLEMQASYKKIGFSLDLDEKLPLKFTTDHNRLSQIIINLLTNAIKFTFTGGVNLSAKVVDNESSSSTLVEIKVTDTGIGIKEKDREYLFQEFTRIEYEQKNINTKGVGLGLVIANKLAKRLGPKALNKGINLSSIYGEGSTFWFFVEDFKLRSPSLGYSLTMNKQGANSGYWNISCREEDFLSSKINETSLINLKCPNSPYAYDFSAGIKSSRSPPELSTLVSPTYLQERKPKFIGKALVVDDDPLNILALESLLKKYGLVTESAWHGKQAIEKVLKSEGLTKKRSFKRTRSRANSQEEGTSSRYQLIFMDYEMPIMNGFEAAKKLTKMMQEKEINMIPIIGCTGHQETQMINECYASGMADFISKPPNQQKLIEILQRYLKSV